MSAIPQLDMVREERRFLMPDVEAVRQILVARAPLTQYRARTLYLDTPQGTWSKDPFLPHIRFRIYNGQDQFLEVKLRVPGTKAYVKKRRKAEGVPDDLVSLGKSLYTRQEWQQD